MSKNKIVSSVKGKSITLPRLELMGMVVGVRLASFITKQLCEQAHVLTFSSQTIWSDSECVLHWLKTKKPLSVFVGNRIREIKSNQDLVFKYVPTHDNPADMTTKGISTDELSECSLWWRGPPWLSLPPNEWPLKNIDTIHLPLLQQQFEQEERKDRPLHEASLNVAKMLPDEFPIEAERFSNHNRLVRASAYVLRFLKIKIWNRLADSTKRKYPVLVKYLDKGQDNGPISANEILAATVWLEINLQRKYFPHMCESKKLLMKGPLRNLRPFIDQDGRIRSRGRLGESRELKDEVKYPVLLPKDDWYTQLFIKRCHQKSFCSGVGSTLSEVRKSHWVLQGRAAVKKVIKDCIICKKWSQKTFKLPVMQQLPESRVTKTRVFDKIGVDLCGPFKVKFGMEQITLYVCLFTCLVVRAIHLEVVFDMSAEQLLMAFRRFIAKHGKPSHVLSDNGSNLTLTEKTLKKAWKFPFPHDGLMDYCSREQITWKFITERAAWEGGVYERLISIMKNCLLKAIGRSMQTLSGFLTYLAEVEAICNSRPLLPLETDSLKILRPIDFYLKDAQLGSPTLAESDDGDDDEYLLHPTPAEKLVKIWERNQKCLDKFWTFWSQDYLPNLREKDVLHHREKRGKASGVPKVGDVVVVQDENAFQSRGMWQLGRVTEVFKGRDGLVHAAKVLLANRRIIKRAVNALCPLEVNAESGKQGTDDSDDSPPKKEEKKKTERRRTRLHFPSLNFSLLVLMISLFRGTQCQLCESGAILEKVESNECVESGFVIFRDRNDNNLCYRRIKCPENLKLNGAGVCDDTCACPHWASGCSYYQGPTPSSIGDIPSILEFAKPVLCSRHPVPQCNSLPSFGTFHQIELFDGTKHLVKELELQVMEPVSQEYHCVGYGTTTGTAEYCETHECQSKGTRFCYMKANDIVYFVSEDGKIPVRSWGKVRIKYYTSKQVPPQNPQCNLCGLTCVKGGVELTLENDVGLVEICSKPYCYHISHKIQSQTVMLPPEITMTEYEVSLKVWSNGFLIKDMGKTCSPAPFCESINCYICWKRITNPQCSREAALVLVFLMVYFASVSLYVILKLVKYLLKSIYFISFTTVQCSVFCIRLCSKAKSYLRSTSNERESDQNETAPRRRRYQPRMIACILIIAVFNSTEACSEVATLTAQQSLCTQSENGNLDCVLSETTRLALSPQGQDACLLIKGPNGEPMGTIAVEVESIQLRCRSRNEYYTRSFEMKVESSKRCPNAGQCTGQKCQDIKTDTKIDDFDEANNFPGFTRCLESCGCAACGCFFCASGCLFFRSYAKPTSNYVYEVFSCPAWEYTVNAKIRLLIQGKQRFYSKTLKPGKSETFDNIRMTLIAITAPPIPMLGSQFVTDGTRVVMVRASASGQPVSGTLGELQCSSRDRASNFDCYLPKDSCQCVGQESTVSCSCNEMSIEALFNRWEYTLPLVTENIVIKGTGTKITAEYQSSASLEVQVTMEGFRLATKVEANTCVIKPLAFGGCYACLTGAKLKFTCTTDFGEALAQVTCGLGSFSTICTPSGVVARTVLNYPNAVIKEECIVNCPGGSSKFHLEGTLVFIEKERIGNISNIIAYKGKSEKSAFDVDFGFLSSILSGNWLAGIVVIVLVIIICIITAIIIPPLATLIFYYVRVCFSNLKKKLEVKLKRI